MSDLAVYSDYLRCNGGSVPLAQFDADWSPDGPSARARLVEAGLAVESPGRKIITSLALGKPQRRVRTVDHPEANGRRPLGGEKAYVLAFPLETGETLVVEMGQKGFDTATNLLMDMLTRAKPHDDGSVGPL